MNKLISGTWKMEKILSKLINQYKGNQYYPNGLSYAYNDHQQANACCFFKTF